MAQYRYIEFVGPKTSRNGIALAWRTTRKVLAVWGWYDGTEVMKGGDLTLEDLANLGVPIDKKALEMETGK